MHFIALDIDLHPATTVASGSTQKHDLKRSISVTHEDAQLSEAFPPEPWRLDGRAVVSFWWVQRKIWAAAWAIYGPSSTMAYNELLAARLVGWPWRPAVEVGPIWVDSPASLNGGRTMWAIPKELARLTIECQAESISAQASRSDQLIASCRYRRGLRLPGRWRVTLETWQPSLLADQPRIVVAHASTRANVSLARADWSIQADGPLGFLSKRSPFLTLILDDCHMIFGRSQNQSKRGTRGQKPLD